MLVALRVLIHVKRRRRSSDSSRLHTPWLVPNNALARDGNSRAAWKKSIAKESIGSFEDAQLNDANLALGSNQPVNTNILFTFAEVNLVKQLVELRYLDVQVRLTTALFPQAED